MKQFNQVITVEVSVDSIAQQLLKTFSSEFKHADALAETIVSTSLDKGTISFLYNSLNGYSNDINFKVGDMITCSESTYGYVPNEPDAVTQTGLAFTYRASGSNPKSPEGFVTLMS